MNNVNPKSRTESLSKYDCMSECVNALATDYSSFEMNEKLLHLLMNGKHVFDNVLLSSSNVGSICEIERLINTAAIGEILLKILSILVRSLSAK